MVVAVVVTAVLYAGKINSREEPFDKMKTTLAGIDEVTPADANITLELLGVANEVPYWVRYILAPRYISAPAYKNDTVSVVKEVNGQKRNMLRVVKVFKYDTALTVYPLQMPDSVAKAKVAGRRVLWQNKDERYAYILTTTH